MTDRRAEGGASVKRGKEVKKLRRALRKIKWLQKELARAKETEALPGPEAAAWPPYECKDENLFWVSICDLQRLTYFASHGAATMEYAGPWSARVMEANKRFDRDLQMIVNGLQALRRQLDYSPLPPAPALDIWQGLETENGIMERFRLS